MKPFLFLLFVVFSVLQLKSPSEIRHYYCLAGRRHGEEGNF